MVKIRFDTFWDYETMHHAIFPKITNKIHGVVNCGNLGRNICKKIINEHLNKDNVQITGRVQHKKGYVINKQIRDVDTWVIHEDQEWIDKIIINTTHTALQSLHYAVIGLLERPQLLRYRAPSKGYSWHTDICENESSIRKISISITLNDDYQGGSMAFFSDKLYKVKLTRGQSIAFPSFLSHKVMPLQYGERWALVAWISGNAFR